ncbi:Ni/Fe hydrogenase subunit alpha [Pseudomonadota bacterium]
MTDKRDVSIRIPVLARVEGEGALEFDIRGGAVKDLKLRIYEPPRLFEKFLEGRGYNEVLDMVARICGICPVAYQMSAVHAIESIFDCTPTPWVREMRRLIYCGEWIESHALHIHLLAAPDFIGYSNVAEMAKDYPQEVRRGLKLQGLGNEIIKFLGARSVHPIGARVGGFYHAPDKQKATALYEKIQAALPEALGLIRWVAAIDIPQDEQSFTSVALRHEAEYAMNEGRIVSDKGLDIEAAEFEKHFKEHQSPHSTALHCLLEGEPYLVGPLARLNLNHDKLPEDVKALLVELDITLPIRNMYLSILARAIEIYYALGEASRILENYTVESASVDVQPKAGVGYACTEAPRGILWHRYETDDNGDVLQSTIVPPTSQNQARIEQDLTLALTQYGLHHSDDELRQRAEMVVRNYDPCISCSTHFLDLRVNRR